MRPGAWAIALHRVAHWLFEAELLIEVWDHRRTWPERRATTLDEEGGRGLVLVESLCKEWGTRSTIQGKVVWATMAAEPPGRPPARSLGCSS